MESIRPAAVAGLFYPGTRETLFQTVSLLLAAAAPPSLAGRRPKALVVPHAGYIYSGPVAAQAYRLLEPFRTEIARVVVLGPVHRVAVRGLALPQATEFDTPLGRMPIDPSAATDLGDLPQVQAFAAAHAPEHSLEVQLPFLQAVLDRFVLVPLAVGNASPSEVAAVVDRLWAGPETLFVVSTDLSHYHPYGRAIALDAATAASIERFEPVEDDGACGSTPLNGFLKAARTRGMEVRRIALANSGDTAGDRDRVVGYGAWAFFEEVDDER